MLVFLVVAFISIVLVTPHLVSFRRTIFVHTTPKTFDENLQICRGLINPSSSTSILSINIRARTLFKGFTALRVRQERWMLVISTLTRNCPVRSIIRNWPKPSYVFLHVVSFPLLKWQRNHGWPLIHLAPLLYTTTTLHTSYSLYQSSTRLWWNTFCSLDVFHWITCLKCFYGTFGDRGMRIQPYGSRKFGPTWSDWWTTQCHHFSITSKGLSRER